MEEVAKEVLPDDMSFSWGGQSYQEKASSGSSSQMMLGGLLMVFLILAALYEPLGLAIRDCVGGAVRNFWGTNGCFGWWECPTTSTSKLA